MDAEHDPCVVEWVVRLSRSLACLNTARQCAEAARLRSVSPESFYFEGDVSRVDHKIIVGVVVMRRPTVGNAPSFVIRYLW